MANGSTGSQINALTATRAVAALLVVIHHFGTAIFPFNKAKYFFSSGNIAVGYFFVLSGFVLYISYCNKEIDYSDYMRKRIGRIVPVYLIALTMAVMVAVAFYHYNLFAAQSVKEILFSALFIQAFIPTYPLCLNGPGWTISIEMFFYVLFPLLLLLQKRHLKFFVAMTVVLFAISQYVHLKYYPIRHSLDDNIVDTVFFNPVIHMNQFLLGMCGGLVYNSIKNRAHKHPWLPFVLFVVIVVLIACRPENISYHVGLIAPVFMLFIISVAIYRPKTLSIAPLVYLGEISYGVYILQQPVYKFLSNINTSHMHIPDQYFFWIALTILIGTASVSYHFIESPIRKKVASFKYRRSAQ